MLLADQAGYAVDGTWLVRGLTLGLKPKEVASIVGPNGAGKTTALRMLAGLLRPSKGEFGWTAGRSSHWGVANWQHGHFRAAESATSSRIHGA